jgi:NAD(P)-dependent dehydrogenase (short-subunit alcohol dehydrogenase family)
MFPSTNVLNSAGIGYAVTAELARHGAKVYLAARNESKAKAAIEKLRAENPKISKHNLVWLPLDLANLDDVEQATRTFLGKDDRLDILGALSSFEQQYSRKNLIVTVNNAGMAAHSYVTTLAGFEMAMGVKYIFLASAD